MMIMDEDHGCIKMICLKDAVLWKIKKSKQHIWCFDDHDGDGHDDHACHVHVDCDVDVDVDVDAEYDAVDVDVDVA